MLRGNAWSDVFHLNLSDTSSVSTVNGYSGALIGISDCV
jgi:hypothetical protein